MDENTGQEIQLKETASALVAQSEALQVNDSESMRNANTFLLSCASMLKRIKAYWKDPRENAHKAWKSICDKEAEMSRIPETARGVVENKLRDYRDAERRRAAEEQRIAEEARRREEERLRQAELKKAEKALDKGNEAKAEEHLEKSEQIFVPPVEIQPSVAKTERTDIGAVTSVMDLEITVVSLRELARAIADGKLPEHLIEARLGQIKTWAKGNGTKNLLMYGLSICEQERFHAREAKAAVA